MNAHCLLVKKGFPFHIRLFKSLLNDLPKSNRHLFLCMFIDVMVLVRLLI